MLRNLPRLRYVFIAAAILALLVAVSPTAAAPLMGGNTIYIINGEETTFTFDPISRKDGLLVPQDVYSALGVSVSATGKQVQLARSGVVATLNLGAGVGNVGGAVQAVAPAPVRLSGRLFLPANLLQEFGFEVVADGSYLQIRDLAAGLPSPSKLDLNGWNSLKQRLSLSTNVRADDGKSYITAEVTFLTADLINNPNFSATFRQRVMYLNLLQTNSLLLVRVINGTGRSATLSPASLMLVDPATNVQYDVVQTLDYQGLISSKIANNAQKTSILVYPKVADSATTITVFSDTNSNALGTLPVK